MSKEFNEINWLHVASAFDRTAILTSFSPKHATIYCHQYGDIEISDNGGEVNVGWSHSRGLELNLPDHHLASSGFHLRYSIPIHNAKQLAKDIKKAIDDAIATAIKEQAILYLPIEEHRPEEVRVIRSGAWFSIQTRKPHSYSWLKYQDWKELDIAVTNAIALYDAL